MSDVTHFVVHNARDEKVRCTRQGALKLLEAEIVLLVDKAHDYLECVKGRELLEGIVRSGQTASHRVLRVNVDSATDDPERMMAAVSVITELNPTGRPPYWLPAEEEA